MQSLEMTSGNSSTTLQFGTWKLLLGNKCGRVARGYSNCWRLWQLLEAAAIAGSCGNCWKLRQLLDAKATAGSCRGRAVIWLKMTFLFEFFFVFCTTPTNWDLRQKAVYFPIWPWGPIFLKILLFILGIFF